MNYRIRCPRGFTLVELLVVIVIISVLASLSFYMVQKLKNSANQAVTTSNIRQLGSLMASYTADNNRSFPDRYGTSWHRLLLYELGFPEDNNQKSDFTPENAPQLEGLAEVFGAPDDKAVRNNAYKRSFTMPGWVVNANGGRFKNLPANEGVPIIRIRRPERAAMFVQNYKPNSLLGQGPHGFGLMGGPTKDLGVNQIILFVDGHAATIPAAISGADFKEKYWPTDR